jgi:hypothetical protein
MAVARRQLEFSIWGGYQADCLPSNVRFAAAAAVAGIDAWRW